MRDIRGGWTGRDCCALYPLESLLEDTFDDFLLHAACPPVVHNIRCASGVHETQGDVKFVAVHPRSTNTKDVGVFRKRHELRFPLQEFQGSQGEAVEIQNLESHGGRCSCPLWLVSGSIDYRRGAETYRCADGVISCVVAVISE